MVMRTSNAVRTWVAEVARTKAMADEMASHKRAATREIVVASESERAALGSAARSVARRVHKLGGEVVRSDINQAIAGKHRRLVTLEAVIEEAERLHWITPTDDGKWIPGEAAPT